MDARTFQVLEFDRVLELTASLAATEVGAGEVISLRPLNNRAELASELDRVAQMAAFIQLEGSLDLEGLEDISPLLNQSLVTGGWLDPEELDFIRRCLACLTRTRKKLLEKSRDYPLLAEMAQGLSAYDQLLARFKKTFGPGLTINDSASPELKRIRRRQGNLKQSIRSELERILESGRSAGLWQEELVTQRSGRFVLPVKSSHQGRFQGIIHDSSASNRTVYMEPLEVTGLNNQLGLMSAEEKAEVKAILRSLTEAVQPLAGQLKAEVALAGRLDCLQARARLAKRLKAVRPELDDRDRLELKQARHPLLVLGREAEGPVVPVDLSFPADKKALVISGPNAGGKTVSLKSLGLLCLMALSGMFIPAAEGSRLPLLKGLAASIGDDQAISEGESTFSARLKWLAGVMDRAGSGWLILIDELGGGTDPAEGAALGLAALDELAGRGGRVAATTHLNHIKAWAATAPEALNLSVVFDRDSRLPTYELVYGRPGVSSALAMAERVGLNESITARARQYLGGREEQFQELLSELADLADRHRKGLNQVEAARQVLTDDRRRLEAELARFEEDKKRLLQEEKVRLDSLLDKAEKRLKRLLVQAGSTDDKARARAKYGFYEQKSGLKKELGRSLGQAAGQGGGRSGFKKGQAVKVEGFKQPGTLLSEAGPGGQAEVRLAGGVKVRVETEKLTAEQTSPEPVRQTPGTKVRTASVGSGSFWPEVKIIGLRVDEALGVVDKALDQAVLGGVDRLLIIHGVGTGALRQAVRRHLVDHPHVNAFASPEGTRGAAVTEVELN